MITKLRTNSHELHSEIGKWTIYKTPWHKIICKLCNTNVIEDETHFLFFICPLYKDIIQTYKDIYNYNLIHEFLNQDKENKLDDYIIQLNNVRNNYSNTWYFFFLSSYGMFPYII